MIYFAAAFYCTCWLVASIAKKRPFLLHVDIFPRRLFLAVAARVFCAWLLYTQRNGLKYTL